MIVSIVDGTVVLDFCTILGSRELVSIARHFCESERLGDSQGGVKNFMAPFQAKSEISSTSTWYSAWYSMFSKTVCGWKNRQQHTFDLTPTNGDECEEKKNIIFCHIAAFIYNNMCMLHCTYSFVVTCQSRRSAFISRVLFPNENKKTAALPSWSNAV